MTEEVKSIYGEEGGVNVDTSLADAEARTAADLKFSNDVELANQSTDWLTKAGVTGDYGSDTGDGSAGTSYTFDPSSLANLSFSKVNDYLKGNRGLASLLGGAGLAALGAGTPTTKSSIYQGGIPNLVATRNMITAPPVGRRAGAGGVNYGGDVTYSLAPEGQKPYATTRGDSAFIADPAGQANVLKGTGGTDPQSLANKISYNLPQGWESYGPQEKISWFNSNNVTYDQLRAAGVPQSDIDYMWSNGYTSGRPADWGKTTAVDSNVVKPVTPAVVPAVVPPVIPPVPPVVPPVVPPAPPVVPPAVPPVVQTPKSEGLMSALDQGMTEDKYISNIKDWLTKNSTASDAEVRAQMDSFGISPADVAKALGGDASKIQDKYNNAFTQGTAQQKADAYNMLLKQGLTNDQIRASIEKTTGKQTDADWSYLQDLAKTPPKSAGGSPPAPPVVSGTTKSAGLMSALEQGMGQDKYISNIKDFLNKNNTASDEEIYQQMQQYGIGAEDVASALGVPVSTIQGKIQALQQSPRDTGYRGPDPEVESRSSGLQSALDQGMDKGQYIGNIKNFLNKNNTASDAEVFKQMQEYGIGAEDVAAALGVPVSTIENKIKALQQPAQSAGMKSAISQGMNQDQYIGNIKSFLSSNANATDAEVYEQMKQYGISADDVASALGVPVSVIKGKLKALGAEGYAQGGMAEGRYLQGGTDGMADEIPAQIGEDQPAALSHGEFVIPADVVSHMGNGNSDAGAKKLYQMMDRIRMARTGNKEQGKKINPDSFMPGGLAKAYANGGGVMGFAAGGTTTLPANVTGTQAGLSNWSGDYTTDLMGQGRALANMPFQQYMGPLTAGPSALQNKVSQGLEGINFPGILGKSFASSAPIGAPTMPADMGTYSPQQKADLYNQFRGQGYGDQAIRQAAGTQTDTDWQNLQDIAAKSGPLNIPQQQGLAGSYMNPYLQNVLQPQLAELNRQSQINLQPSLAKLTSAGGYGGGRQAIMESEAGRNLLNAQNTAIGTGYANAYDKAMQQFNTEQGQGATLAGMMSGAGATNRAIEAEGVAADKAQFEEARANPYKMVQFQQSLLSGMPINAMDYTIQDPSTLTKVAQGVNTVDEMLRVLYGIDPAKKK